MEEDRFKVVSKKSNRKRPAKEMETDEVDIGKILDAEMKVPEPKMPQFKATREVGTANQVRSLFMRFFANPIKQQLETRRVVVPAHRYTPLKENWMKIFTPVVEHLGLQIRFNTRTRTVELKVC